MTEVFSLSLYRFACLQIPYGWWKHECNYKHLDILHVILDFLVIYVVIKYLFLISYTNVYHNRVVTLFSVANEWLMQFLVLSKAAKITLMYISSCERESFIIFILLWIVCVHYLWSYFFWSILGSNFLWPCLFGSCEARCFENYSERGGMASTL